MIAFDDAREMERRAKVCCGDGLLDIGVGLGLIVAGFSLIFGLGALAVVYAALVIPIARSAKRNITVPRMHHLDFMPDPDTESKARRTRAVIAAAPAVLLAVGILALLMSRPVPERLSGVLRGHALVIFGCMLAAFFGAGAWITAAKRMRAYAEIAVFFLVCGYWFGMKVSVYLMIVGSFVAVYGAAVLSRFIREYPRFFHRSGREYQRSF
jgi:amino acid transporter